jgi:hypothetical protein
VKKIIRTEGPCFIWDSLADRGFNFATGEAHEVSDQTAAELLQGEGWQTDAAPSSAPKPAAKKKVNDDGE